MKKEIVSNRGEKIASKVQILVAQILLDNFSDDKIISGVSLVGSEAYGRLHFVKLFYYVRSGTQDAAQKRLADITKSIRFELAGRIEQRYVPDIKFIYDDTLERASRIDALLANIS